MAEYGWTPERVRILHLYWREGLSASQIACMLGGVSRNAVIGKLHRTGAARRANPALRPAVKRARAVKSPKKRAARAVRLPPSPLPDPTCVMPPLRRADGSLVTVLTLERGKCRWPYGDVREEAGVWFCAAPVAAQGCPYCAGHMLAGHQPAPRKRVRTPDPVRQYERQLRRMELGR